MNCRYISIFFKAFISSIFSSLLLLGSKRLNGVNPAVGVHDRGWVKNPSSVAKGIVGIEPRKWTVNYGPFLWRNE